MNEHGFMLHSYLNNFVVEFVYVNLCTVNMILNFFVHFVENAYYILFSL